MSKNQQSLREKLETAAARILDESTSADSTFMQRLEAFKAVTQFHLGTSKLKGGAPDDDEGPKAETSFNAIRSKIEAATDPNFNAATVNGKPQ